MLVSPQKKIIPKFNHNTWITRGIRTSCTRKRELYLKLRQNNDPDLKLYYRRYCNVLAKVIREAKKAYYDNALLKSRNKIKTTWSIIKKETRYKTYDMGPQVLKVNNTVIKDKGSIANVFNEYFSSIAQIITKDLNKDNNVSGSNMGPLHYLDHSNKSSFENIRWHYTSVTEIRKIIKTLKTKSSYGYNEIPIKILKISMPHIVSPLTYICNESLAQGIFPDRLNYAAIKPIF